MIEDWLSNWKSNINTSYIYLLVARILRYFSLLNMKHQSQCKIHNTEPLSPLCYVEFPNCSYRFQFLSVIVPEKSNFILCAFYCLDSTCVHSDRPSIM